MLSFHLAFFCNAENSSHVCLCFSPHTSAPLLTKRLKFPSRKSWKRGREASQILCNSSCQRLAWEGLCQSPTGNGEGGLPVHSIIAVPIIVDYFITLTFNPICIFIIYPRKVQITYSPLLNQEQDLLGIVLQDLLF